MKIDFTKNPDRLVPAIIQDAHTKNVLMLGYMNQEAFDKTIETNKVTFYSRTKNRLWTKGEESGHFLNLVSIKNDCDNDTLLLSVNPMGPTCHTGSDTCWQEANQSSFGFLTELEAIIKDRKNNPENKDSNDHLFLDESADLLFHYLILLQAKGFTLGDIEEVLKKRH